jgi:hypothetical protein
MAYDEREAQGASGSGGSGEGSRGPRAYWAEGQIPWPEMRRRMREAFREGFRPGDPEWKRFFRQFFDGESPNGENRRSNVLSLRVDDRTLGAIDSLVEAGLFSTRAESATWLLQAGVAANGELFDQINTTVAEIRRLREELQRKMNAATGAPSQDGDTTAPQDTQPTQTGEGEPQHW